MSGLSMGSGTSGVKRRILIADDDESVARLFQRVLSAPYHEVVCARDGAQAKAFLQSQPFDVVVSDINMPGMDGIQLLRAVRQHDLDVPVVLVTGTPDVQTAVRAVQYGALRYLIKPVEPKVLQEIVTYAIRVHDLAKIKREALSLIGGKAREASDRAGLEASFTRAVDSVWMAYQPIVCWSQRNIYAYEALVRSRESALHRAGALLDAADRLDLVLELGKVIRQRVAEAIPRLPGHELIFLNLHPKELEDEALYSNLAPLSPHAERIVLEITERARLEGIRDVKDRTASLRSMGFRLAVDDLGSGYAGLTSFIHLNPELVKIDMALVRDVHRHPSKQKLIRSMLDVCKDMGIEVVIEGVETKEEQNVLVNLGSDLLQGYLFGTPAEHFTLVPPADLDG